MEEGLVILQPFNPNYPYEGRNRPQDAVQFELDLERALKPRITQEFLRGVLSTYIAYECCQGFISVPRTLSSARLALAAVVLFIWIVYLVLLYCLLYRPERSSTVVLVVLCVFALLSIVSASRHLSSPGPEKALGIASSVISVGMAGIAYIYFRGQRPGRGV